MNMITDDNFEQQKERLLVPFKNFSSDMTKSIDEVIAEHGCLPFECFCTTITVLKTNHKQMCKLVNTVMESIGFKAKFDMLTNNEYTNFIKNIISKAIDSSIDKEKVPTIRVEYPFRVEELSADWQLINIKESLWRFVLESPNNFSINTINLSIGKTEYNCNENSLKTFPKYFQMITDYYKQFARGN